MPDEYLHLPQEALAARIEAARAALGPEVLILAHHYQRDEVIRHADLVGDSLRLSRSAADIAERRRTRAIVFCGVDFMAETADLLAGGSVAVLHPNPAAACPMAAMADADVVLVAWCAMHQCLGPEWRGRIVPVAYVNTSAAVKAFTGLHGGACCTSGNAAEVLAWALRGGAVPARPGEDVKVLFLPDEHLGRNTAARLGLRRGEATDAGAGLEILTWGAGSITPPDLHRARIILWNGFCSVHLRFRPEQVDEARRGPGTVRVIVHPECRREVVERADEAGSTERIIERVEASPPGSAWAVGTEAHLVHRLGRAGAARGVSVRPLGARSVHCAAMYRIAPADLLWVLDNLGRGHMVNRVRVDAELRQPARLAVQRMLDLAARRDA
jgi:quinolinate synthase